MQGYVYLKTKKLELLSSSVVYLDHFADAEKIHPAADKVHAIWQAPTP